MSHQYLPIGESATYLSISVDTLRRWEKSGKIKGKRLDGKNRFFAVKDLERLKNGHFLSIRDAAKRLNTSEQTLRRLSATGIIPCIREENGYRRFAVEDIEKYMDNQHQLASDAKMERLVVSSKNTEKKDIVEKGSVPAVTKSLVTSLFDAYKTMQGIGREMKFINHALITYAVFFIVSFLVLLISFAYWPDTTSSFFHFYAKNTDDVLEDVTGTSDQRTVLGAVSESKKISQPMVLGVTTTLLAPQIALSTQIIEAINPDHPINEICLPGQCTTNEESTSVREVVARVGATGAKGDVGPAGEDGEDGASGTVGITRKLEEELSSKRGNITFTEKDNAKEQDWATTAVIDLTGTKMDEAKEIAAFLGAHVITLPTSEPKPSGSDILIIVGADRK